MKMRLRELRIKKGWTQATAAHESGISLDHIRSLEIGRALPSLKVACQLKTAYGCNYIDDLIEVS